MSYISVILKEDVKSLGKKNEVVKVKDGYARNFLFANSLAIPFTISSKNTLSKESADKEAKEIRIKEESEKKKDVIDGKSVKLKVKSKDGKLFGAIVHKDIADAIYNQLGLKVDKKKIYSENIKSLGTFNISIKLHKEVLASVNLEVESL